MSGINRQSRQLPQQKHLYSPATAFQQPRNNKTIAAIIARPTQHQRFLRFFGKTRFGLQQRFNHAIARAFHHGKARDKTSFNSIRFGAAHLFARQNFMGGMIKGDKSNLTAGHNYSYFNQLMTTG